MNTAAFSLPIAKRKYFCMSVCLIAGVAMAMTLPADVVREVPMVRIGTVINMMLIGMAITLIGTINLHPVFQFRIPSFVRGALVAAFVHLDFVIYIWPQQGEFWTAIAVAAVFGAIVDFVATTLFGDGAALCAGVTR